jgi:hypothetical protein
MFVESMRRVPAVRRAAHLGEPFRALHSIRERPLMVAVPWPDKNLTEQDHALVRELSLHLSGAFFGCEL